MPKYPMTEVIARREFDYSDQAGPAKVVALLGKPAIMPDAPNGDWYCPYVVEWPKERHEFYAGGIIRVAGAADGNLRTPFVSRICGRSSWQAHVARR